MQGCIEWLRKDIRVIQVFWKMIGEYLIESVMDGDGQARPETG